MAQLQFTPGAPAASDALVWDIDNHLSSYTKNGVITTFKYDALGRRLEKTTGTNSTLFISSGQQVIEEYDRDPNTENWVLNTSYIYASYIDDVVSKIEAPGTTGGSPVTHYYHSDRQFNVRALTNSGGTTLELYAYSPYGKQVIMNGSGSVISASDYNKSYGFTGRRLDAETGLWYFRARYFSESLGRFIGRDPMGYVDGMSLYNGYFAENFQLDPTGWEEEYVTGGPSTTASKIIPNFDDPGLGSTNSSKFTVSGELYYCENGKKGKKCTDIAKEKEDYKNSNNKDVQNRKYALVVKYSYNIKISLGKGVAKGIWGHEQRHALGREILLKSVAQSLSKHLKEFQCKMNLQETLNKYKEIKTALLSANHYAGGIQINHISDPKNLPPVDQVFNNKVIGKNWNDGFDDFLNKWCKDCPKGLWDKDTKESIWAPGDRVQYDVLEGSDKGIIEKGPWGNRQ